MIIAAAISTKGSLQIFEQSMNSLKYVMGYFVLMIEQ
jgi:hypothetical protein